MLSTSSFEEDSTVLQTPDSSFSDLDPILGSLGVLTGLLKKNEDDSYSLIPEWFNNPYVSTKAGIVKNPAEFNTLFEELLGKIGGNSFGIPIQNPGLLGNWFPIKYQKDGKDVNTGVYAVTYQSGSSTVMGVGVYHAWEFGSPSTLQSAVWGLIPFVAVDAEDSNDPVKMTFVSEGFPIVFGAAVNGPDPSSPLIDINGIQFNGVKVNANIDLAKEIAGKSPFELGVEIIGLQLAGEDKPSNRSLSDLEAITAEKIMDTASSLFVGGLSKVFPELSGNIQYFPPLFGLSSQVPKVEGAPNATLPILKWYELFNAAKNNNAETIFLNWFNAIAADNNTLKTWLSCLSGFLKKDIGVSGDGSRSSPFLISLLDVSTIGTLSLSMGTEVIGESTRVLYPGMAFSGSPFDFGSSGIAFTMQAESELARFQITGDAIGLSPSINFTAKFNLKNKTEAQPLAEFTLENKAYSIGSLEGGMSLGSDSSMMPWFGLNAVTIGSTHYDTLNLLSPGQLANAGAVALSEGLQSLLEFGTENKKLSQSIGTLIGLQTPSSAGANWPENLIPPFSPSGMATSITNPIGAWASYYSNVLSCQQQVSGKEAFYYVVESFAQLLQASTDSLPINISGSGTKQDPWKAGISIKDQTLPAYLVCFQESITDYINLNLGLELAPELTLKGTDIVASLALDAATIRLPKDGNFSHTTADWLSGVAARLTLPKGFETPAIGGMQVKVDTSQLSATWNQNGGWSWSMLIKGPTLVVDGTPTALGTDLNFDDQSTLQDLVKQSASTFGPFLVSALGTMLLRTQSKPGLFLAGAMGLVKDLTTAPAFPESGLSWSGFELYPFTSFTDPWTDFNKQIDQLFNTDTKGKSVLGLLAYTMSGTKDAPAILGSGTFTDPWITPIPFGFNLPVWYNTGKQNLGLGFGRQDLFKYPGSGKPEVAFNLEQRLNLVEYSTQNKKIEFIDDVPSLNFIGTLFIPNAKLVDLGSIGNVDKIMLGLTLSLEKGEVNVKPVVTLVNAQLGTDFQDDLVTLEQFLSDSFASNLQAAFLALLNGALQTATTVEAVTDNSGFQTTYKLLQLIGLTLPRANDQAPYGINTSGWNALLASSDAYLKSQFKSLLMDPAHRKELFDFLQEVTGITIPSLPVPALQFLSALHICGPVNQGYPLLPEAVLEVFTNPVQGLTSRFENFFTDANAVRTLATQIASNQPPASYGPFTFSTTTNGVISLNILPEHAISLGEFVNLYGNLQLNISDETLTFTGDIYIPKIGLTLASSLGLRMNNGALQTPAFEIQLIWGDGQKPAASPLDIYPFNTSAFVDQVSELAPAYTLNILLNAIFEEELLGKYELVQKIFEGLGIGKDEDGIWRMPSMMGILSDPLGWILSDEVLGNQGNFSVPKLIALLGNLPEVTYNDIQVTPSPGKGMELTGLPYGFKVGMTGENNLAIFNFGVDTISIVSNQAAIKNLNFGVSLNESYQPAFSGGLDLEATIPSLQDGFFTHVAYDKEFQFRISQGTTAKPTGLGVQLLPFQGWGTLAGQALATGSAVVINEVVPKLMNFLLAKYPSGTSDAGKFLAAMDGFATKMHVNDLVSNIISAFSQALTEGLSGEALLQELEKVAFEWVKQRFSTANANDTATAIADLLKLALPKDSLLSVIDGRIQYIPSAKLPFKLLAGLDSSNSIGLWAGAELPDMKLLKMEIAPTGVAYNLDKSQFDISFGLDMIVPIENLNGPGLSINFSNGQFDFGFDPLADPSNMGTPSALNVELLPNFFGGGNVGDKVSSWMLNVIKDVLPRYVSLLVLNQDQVKTWLQAPLIKSSAISPALLLEATQLVEDTEGIYVLTSFDKLAKLTPKEFLGNFLFTLLKEQWTLLSFSEEGKIIIGPKSEVDGYYGLLIQAPNLSISAIPNLVFQLGGKNTDWITNSVNGTPAFGDRGIGLYVPIAKNGNDSYSVDFTYFNLVLNNVGFDIIGKNGQPIVDLSRFKLGSVDPRALFDLQFRGDQPIKIQFGAGLSMDEMGLSLSPKTITEGGGNNPIAKNVLGSGESDDDNKTTDPRFSVDVGYIDKLWVNLRSNTGNGHEVIIPVQRSFGPLFIENIGLGWEGEKTPPLLDFISSGSFELAGFKAALQGLRVGMPVTAPTDWSKYTIDLDGFAVDYTGGVTINAGFLKSESDGIVEYTGVAILSAKKFSLGALGSYAQIKMENGDTSTSMFIFGVLNAPLGGIPAFFIEGIAAGFAYNRGLDLPGIEGVANFPLVKGVADGSFTQGEDPMAALLKLNEVIRPQVGQYWLAAGLKFSSFQLLETTALLFLSFGKDFEFNLLGVSTATLPPKVSPNLALAYMELAIKVTISPAAGYVSAEAQLTPNSFVLAKDVKLTGGFAFFLWFKDIPLKDGGMISAGDFVVTLGGYHPAFNRPVYYPDVPRLGINWKLDFSVGKVSISGGAYFAICPTAIMSGGYLKIAFDAGPLIAGLDAYANFLIEWEPFYFNVGIGVTVYAGFQTTIAGVSVRLVAKLGCTLELQGPPVFGKVEVDWYIISFSIPIGNQDNHPSTASLDWSAFEASFLPAPTSSSPSPVLSNARVVMLNDENSQQSLDQQVVKWTAQTGLERDSNDGEEGTGKNEWVLNPIPWKLTVASAIPSSTVTVSGSDTSLQGSSHVGVRPMGKEDQLVSPMTIALTDASGAEINLKARNINLTGNTNGAPSALWSRAELDHEVAPDPDTMLISNVLYGLVLDASQYVYSGVVPEFPLENLAYVTGDVRRLSYDFTPNYPSAELYPAEDQKKAFTMIRQTIMDETVVKNRNDIYRALQASAINAPLDPSLVVMASSANLILQDFPVLARIGIYQNNGVVEAGKPILLQSPSQDVATETAPIREPQLVAQLQTYKTTSRDAPEAFHLPKLARKAKGQWKTTHKISNESYLSSLADFCSTRSKALYDGTTLVWKTDPKLSLDLELLGELPSLIASFDEYGSLLGFEHFSGPETFGLPAETGQVLVQGFETNPDAVLGWQINTMLSKINSGWFLADGCLIRAQNSRQIKPRTGRIGHVKASDLVDQNLVKTSGNTTRKGWIQTVFPRQSQVFGVLLKGKAGVGSIGIAVAADEVPSKSGAFKATAVQAYGENTLLLFDAPTKASAYYGILISLTDQQTEILGMYALGDNKAMKSELAHQLSLVQCGIDFGDSSHRKTSVKLIQKQQIDEQ
ncbi:hypothetical protein SAMN04489724_0103 [Algoriphagus locisalis]|uniref:DUF6603 domain-containing protein n=1 Tax=Algoriphagus locisalis TaxID=305507 RepID=A0A1I7E599_9BACT|nr:DUF6603 domain-containing protein [Algoriphagus locisalis]SFU19118.1 hypothetical protein SAMN04489724_0103 [Algoriphagus locisalis]